MRPSCSEAHNPRVSFAGSRDPVCSNFPPIGGGFPLIGKPAGAGSHFVLLSLIGKSSAGNGGSAVILLDRESGSGQLPTCSKPGKRPLCCETAHAQNLVSELTINYYKHNIIMVDLKPFSSLLEASNRASTITVGNFSLQGEDMTDGAQVLVRCFNSYWDTTIYALITQLRFFFTNTYRIHQYGSDQLGSCPALQICGKIKESKTKIDLEELIAFVETIFKMDFDDVFKVPEIEATETQVIKKRKKG